VKRGIVYALVAAVLFGVSTPLAKRLVGEVPPLVLAGLLYASSGVGLLVVLAGRAIGASGSRAIAFPARGDWRWLAGAIALGRFAGPVALMFGLARSAASTASLLLNLEAVFTALIAWFMFRENLDRRIALGLAAIVAGGLVLAWAPIESGGTTLGLLLIVAACLCWGIDNNLTRRISAADAVVIAALKGLIAGAINLALAFALGYRLPALVPWASAAAVGFFGYGVSLVLYVLALRHLGAARAGAYFSVAPFFGALLAIALQHEPVTWQLAIAEMLMAAGVWLHINERHSHEHVHASMQHAHSHVHDEHHRHAHAFDWDGREPHTHSHEHAPIVHTHPHYPDVHHRHPH
jgi:drug/metabolite transporter (DMT)-like permease